MRNVEILKEQLLRLRDEVNATHGREKLSFHQQPKVKEHMSFTGCNGRIYITPSKDGYDVSLSGISVELELTPVFLKLFGKTQDGYKQPNSNTGEYRSPYWRTGDFNLVKAAVNKYAETKK